MKFQGLRRTLAALAATLLLALPAVSHATTVSDRDPSALRMTGDLFVARPFMLGATLIGSAVFVLGLPFHALGGNTGQAANTLVIEPAKNTFFRCLGCVERVPDNELKL